jgi:hypothetical protein
VIVVFLRRTRINPQSGFERLCRVMLDVVLDVVLDARTPPPGGTR